MNEVLAAFLGGLGVVAVAAAVGSLYRFLRGRYRRGPGRRRESHRRLARLSTGAQLSRFVDVLGTTPAIRRRAMPDHMESVFLDQDFYVQAITDADETVVAYAVTTCERDFKPTFSVPGLGDIQLGVTRFGDIELPPQEFVMSVGARRGWYHEFHYLGNPGFYLYYAFALNDAGVFDAPGDLMNELQGATSVEAIAPFREKARINTYAVMDFGPDKWPAASIGPDLDTIRMIPH